MKTYGIIWLSFIFLFAGIRAGYSASGVDYSRKTDLFNLDVTNKTLKEVFSEIEKISDYAFLYYDEAMDIDRTVSIHAKELSIAQILDELFDGTDNHYVISGRQIYIQKADTVSVQPSTGQERSRTITGSVVDEKGEMLVGVTIRVKNNPSVGTATDINGNFVLKIEPGDLLEVSYLGYRPKEVPTLDKDKFVIIMSLIDEVLETVQVVGYGRQKAISVIGSQQSIKAEKLKLPVANLTNSLAGQVSGLVSVQRTGEPGNDDATIYIRGISTLTASLSKPLTLVDGVPRSISNVDPEDIESFTILKDASATAVYGVRGANGVIIINTKSGRKGKPHFTFRYTEGITMPTRLPSFTDGATYMEIANEASMTRGGNALYSQEQIQMTRTGADPYLYPNVDWFDEILRDVSRNRSGNVNISGGSDNAVYYIGLNYYDEAGMYKDASKQYNNNAYYKRYGVTSNITLTPTRTTEIKLGIQGYLANANYPATLSEVIFQKAFFMTPIYVAPMYPGGKLGDRIGGEITNPYALLTGTGYKNQWRNQIFSNLRATQQLPFLDGLSATAMFAFDAYNSTENSFSKTPDTWRATGRDAAGNLIFTRTREGSEYLSYSNKGEGSRTIYIEAALNYQQTFAKDHAVTGMLLFNQSDEINTKATSVEEALPYRFRGLAGRFTYSFKERYFAEFNFGYNGSENFAPKERYGFFPSFGLGWVISNEPFFAKATKYIQHLKIRGTWGKVGNSNLGGRRFAYIATLKHDDKRTSYVFGKNQDQKYGTLAINQYAVDATWETSKKINLGLDIMTLRNKLNIQFDIFKELREGIFLQRRSVPSYTGLITAPYGNVGKVENKGFELSLNYFNVWGDWSLSLMGNYSFNRNKVLDDDLSSTYPWTSNIGYKVGQRHGLIALGLFESEAEILASPQQSGDTRPGDIKFMDINGDGKIDDYDKAPIGWGSVPEIMYGFGFSVGWKNIVLSAMFQGAAHVDATLSGQGLQPFNQGESSGNLMSNIGDRWTEENPSQDVFYPRLTIGNLNMNNEPSTWWLKSTAYMRLKNIELSYTIPAHLLNRVQISNLRVFVQGVNLLTFSSFKLWDVELGDSEHSVYPAGAAYPNIASVSLGVNFNF